jgi:2'-5' RNA ligase
MAEDSSTRKLRLFVAITVPDTVRPELLRVQSELQPLVPRGTVRWTKPQQFHLTLRFLGDIPFQHVAGLQTSLRAVCVGIHPLHLLAQGVGFFPNARSPRVIWVGIHDRENRLLTLQQKVESTVQPYTTGPGGDRFAGHITLGRCQDANKLNVKELINHAGSMKNRLFGEWTAREIELIRSELLPGGAHYTSLAACQLEAAIELS